MYSKACLGHSSEKKTLCGFSGFMVDILKGGIGGNTPPKVILVGIERSCKKWKTDLKTTLERIIKSKSDTIGCCRKLRSPSGLNWYGLEYVYQGTPLQCGCLCKIGYRCFRDWVDTVSFPQLTVKCVSRPLRHMSIFSLNVHMQKTSGISFVQSGISCCS